MGLICCRSMPPTWPEMIWLLVEIRGETVCRAGEAGPMVREHLLI